MEISPVQMSDLNGKWYPKGTKIQCGSCGGYDITGVDMYVLPEERIVCSKCSQRSIDEENEWVG